MVSDEDVTPRDPGGGQSDRSRAGAVLPAVAVLPILAHLGHPTHGIDPAIPAAVFLSGLLFVAAGVYLDRRPDVAPIYSDVGFGAGVISVVGAVALMFV